MPDIVRPGALVFTLVQITQTSKKAISHLRKLIPLTLLSLFAVIFTACGFSSDSDVGAITIGITR
ncbi:MAG: hypothetical protein HOE50_10505 [Chloroflexi bacterium]|nr:hypothetical protein [Chloroflexota bacterium]